MRVVQSALCFPGYDAPRALFPPASSTTTAAISAHAKHAAAAAATAVLPSASTSTSASTFASSTASAASTSTVSPSSTIPSASPPCNLTTWSSDGFGHQLAAILSCKLLALAKPDRYRYVPSVHTEIEHQPVGASALLEFLGTLFLDKRSKKAASVHGVTPRSYHRVCDGGMSRRPPPCTLGAVTICDNCFRMFDPAAHQDADRLAAAELRRRIAAASGVGDGNVAHASSSCPRRAAVCVHQRGLGAPGAFNDTRHTTERGERESLWRRSYPVAWWRRAAEAALATISGGGQWEGRAEVERLVVVHTNNLGLANNTFGPLDASGSRPAKQPQQQQLSPPQQQSHTVPGTGLDALSVHVLGPDVPLLMLLHELIFCCETLVVGTSALSSVVAWARIPQLTIAHTAKDIHLNFPYQVV